MDHTELKLKQALKNWSKSQSPPSNGRARLITAVLDKQKKEKTYSPALAVELPGNLVYWAMVYSLDRGVTALRLVS